MHDIKALVLLKMSNKCPEVLLDLSVHTPVLKLAWCNFGYLAAKLQMQGMQLMDMSRGHFHEEIEQMITSYMRIQRAKECVHASGH